MTLAAFRVPSFRFQWSSDLLTSWAFEMETLVLGWYVLVNTGSVLWLTAFGSLQFLGTLASPGFGGAYLAVRCLFGARDLDRLGALRWIGEYATARLFTPDPPPTTPSTRSRGRSSTRRSARR